MINRKRLTDEFSRLAAFDSESFHEKETAGYLFEKLRSLGLDVTRDDAGKLIGSGPEGAGNIYGFLKGNSEGESLLFSAHMDTVSPGKGKKPVFHEDGTVTSDGTTVLGADDITGIAAILELLQVIQEDGLSHPDIEVVFFVAEEPYGRGSSVFDYLKIRSKTAYVLDLDGPVGTIANRAPTILQFRAEVTGKSAHAGFEPEKGISAIAALSKAVSELKLGRIDEETTANVGTIGGGTGKNIVPGSAYAEGEVRSLSDEKAWDLAEEIGKTFTKAAEEQGAKVAFTAKEMVHAYSVEEDAPVIKRYAKAMEGLGFGKPRIITTFGGSDNNNLSLHGISGIVVANAMNHVHTTQEYFSLDELEKSTEILLKLL